ncbi:MAG TPA: GNAT family N-acetyltransferase [Blastocatellia bacterium]|nr:GNAT family N-acetyltransferase [Blastocatellia bacterium]
MNTVEKITTREGFAALEQEWNALLQQSASNSLTLTWEWLATWWEVFGEDRELCILVAREADQVIGIAPLARRTVQHYGVLPFRRLEFLASGEDEADEICSEYLDFILRRGHEVRALEALFAHLQADDDWDEFLLTDIAEESPNLPLAQQLVKAGGAAWQVARTQTGIFKPLPAGYEAFLAGISSGYRQKIRRDTRAAIANGVEFVIVSGAQRAEDSCSLDVGIPTRMVTTVEGFNENFETLIRLHQERWTSRGERGVFASSKFARFHRLVGPRLLAKGWVELYLLVSDRRPIAALYDFIYGNKMYYYQSGLASDQQAIHSPGILIRGLAIKRAIGLGLAECDFLKGRIEGYKAGWRGEIRNILQVRIARAHSKEAVYKTAAKVIDGLKQLKRSLQS